MGAPNGVTEMGAPDGVAEMGAPDGVADWNGGATEAPVFVGLPVVGM